MQARRQQKILLNGHNVMQKGNISSIFLFLVCCKHFMGLFLCSSAAAFLPFFSLGLRAFVVRHLPFTNHLLKSLILFGFFTRDPRHIFLLAHFLHWLHTLLSQVNCCLVLYIPSFFTFKMMITIWLHNKDLSICGVRYFLSCHECRTKKKILSPHEEL